MEVEPPSPEGEGAAHECRDGREFSEGGAGAPPFIVEQRKKKYLGRYVDGASLDRQDKLQLVREVDSFFGLRSANALEECGSGFAVYRCETDAEHAGIKKHLGCKRAYCPVCGPDIERRRASEAWDHVKGYDKWYWMITAGVPGAWREKVLADRNWDGKIARAIHRAVERTMGGRWGSVYSQHMFSSREPWREQPHVHVLGPRRYVTQKGGVGVCGWFDLKALRAAYKVEIEKAFGEFPFQVGTSDGLPVMYVELREAGVVKRHTLPYMVRGPMDWRKFGGFREGGRKFVYASRLKKVNGRKVPVDWRVLTRAEFRGILGKYEHGRHRVRYLGYLHARARAKLAAKFPEVEAVVRHEWKCAVCGGRMVVAEIHRGEWDWVRGESASDYENDSYYLRDKQERDRRRAEKEALLGDGDVPEWV